MEIGGLTGLAVRDNKQSDIENLKYLDALNKQNEAMLAAKVKMFSEDIEFQTASNNYDAARIKEEGEAAIAALSELRRQHPHDYFTNPDVQFKAKQIKQGMKSSPAVLRSLAYKDAQAKYNAIFEDALNNPSKYDEADLDAIRTKLANYDKWGNADGEAGFQRDGGARPMTFVPPIANKDLNDLFSVARDIEPDEMTTLHNGRDGAYIKRVSEKSLRDLATTMYESEPEQYRRFTKAGKDPITEIMNGLRTRAKTETFNGFERDKFYEHEAYKAKLKAALSSAPSETVYKNVIIDSDNIPIDAGDYAATFGDTPRVQYRGPDGNIITESGEKFYAENIRDKNYTTKTVNGKKVPVKYNKDGMKVVDGFILKSLDDPMYQDVLYDDKFIGKEMKVKDSYKDVYSIYRNPEGKEYLKIQVSTDVDANNPAYARKFESRIKSTTKQRENVGSESMINEAREYQEDAQGNRYYKGIDY